MKKIANAIANAQMSVACVCLAVTVIAVLLQMFSRYFGISMRWTEDLTKYPFAWSIFLGSSTMYYRKAHFRMDVLESYIPKKWSILLQIFIYAVLLVFTVAMVIFGMEMTQRFWNYNWMTLPQIKLGPTYLVVPFSGLTMSYFSVCHVVDGFAELKSLKTGGEIA